MADEANAGANPANPYSDAILQSPPTFDVRLRPTGVTVVGVLACVLGMMGLAMGCWMLIHTIVGPRIAQAFTQAGPNQQAQMEMNDRMEQLSLEYRTVNVATSLGAMILGAALFIGGIGTIRGRPWARTLLVRAFLVAMIFECFRLVPATMMQFEILPIMEQFMQRVTTDPSGKNPSPPPMAASFAKAMMLIGVCIGVGWLVIKLACFGFCGRYLSRPHVRAFFDSDTPRPRPEVSR